MPNGLTQAEIEAAALDESIITSTSDNSLQALIDRLPAAGTAVVEDDDPRGVQTIPVDIDIPRMQDVDFNPVADVVDSINRVFTPTEDDKQKLMAIRLGIMAQEFLQGAKQAVGLAAPDKKEEPSPQFSLIAFVAVLAVTLFVLR